MYLKTFKNSKRYLAFALTFLMPIYPNFELLAGQNKEKIEVSENIKNKNDAIKEIERIVELTIKAEKNKNFTKAISYLEKGIEIEKKFFGRDHPDVADSYIWIGKLYENLNLLDKAEVNYNKSLKIRKKK